MTGIETLVKELRGVAGLPAALYPMARAAEREAHELDRLLHAAIKERDEARGERDALRESLARSPRAMDRV